MASSISSQRTSSDSSASAATHPRRTAHHEKPLYATDSIATTLYQLSYVPDDDDDEEEQIDHCCSHLVLHQFNTLRVIWTVTVLVLLIYTGTIFLFRLCFCSFHINEDGPDPVGNDEVVWKAIELCVDYFFIFDLLISFFLSYTDTRGVEVDSLRLIARRYMLGYFWINLLACLPESAFEGIATIFETSGDGQSGVNKIARVTRMQRIPRLARLMRLTRLARFLQHIDSPWWRWFQRLRGVRVVNFILSLLWSLHLLACFWYLVAALHDDPKVTWVGRHQVDASGTSLLNQGPLEQWLVAMYFILTVFTTVGFGDISAGTEAEIMFVCFTMVVGAVVNSIIISEVISIVTSTDALQAYVERNHKLIDAFSEHSVMPEAVQKLVKQEVYWRSRFQASCPGFDKQEMAELITGKVIPRWLLCEMAANIYDGRLIRSAFIQCCSTSFAATPPRLPLLLACYLSRVQFEAGEVVYQLHDYPFNLFIVLHGTFAHVGRPTPFGGIEEMQTDTMDFVDSSRARTPGSECSMIFSKNSGLYPYRIFSHNSYFGDYEIFKNCPRVATVRCERSGTALVLHKTDLQRLEDQFPHFRPAWERAAHSRERQRLAACRKLMYGLNLKHLAALRIQSHFRRPRRPRLQRCGSQFAETVIQQQWFEDSAAALCDATRGAGTPSVLPAGRKPAGNSELKQQVDHLRISMDSVRGDVCAIRREMHEMRVLLEAQAQARSSSPTLSANSAAEFKAMSL